MRIKLISVLIAICFTSCFINSNLWEAMYISKKFTQEYTGLDTLIKIDGYYYREDSVSIITPFILSNNRKFQISPGRYKHKNHIQVQESLKEELGTRYMCSGNYRLSGDTINAKWVLCYDWGYYNIYSEKYLIINDTTLKEIWRSWKNPGEEKETITVTNDIYHFYEYKFDMK